MSRTIVRAEAAEARAPRISVVLPTRNRAADLRRCLASLADVRYPDWEALLIDQSDDDQARAVAEELARDLPRLRYRRSGERGCAAGYNAGLAEADGAIIAFLNDDCSVPADWLASVAATFQRHPQAGVVFGAVRAAPHLPSEAFIPAYAARAERRVQGRWECARLGGMGACMCVRRAVARCVGPFDARLGPGAYFGDGGDDVDYRYRCLALGYGGVATPAISVLHHGARRYADGSAADLLRGYAYSAGAMVMKHLRCGDPAALLLLARGWPYLLARDAPRASAMRPAALAWMCLRGMRDSFRLEVDRRRRLYLAPA